MIYSIPFIQLPICIGHAITIYINIYKYVYMYIDLYIFYD